MAGLSRRQFAGGVVGGLGSLLLPSGAISARAGDVELFRIALMSWSFHMELWRGQVKATELPGIAREMEVEDLEWASKTLRPLDGGRDIMYQAPPVPAFFNELRRACDDAGVGNRVMSVGGPYYLASVDRAGLDRALDFFLQYVEPARILGCGILRAELYFNGERGPGWRDEAQKRAAEGLQALLEKTEGSGLTINVENHHGISSRPEWLAGVVRKLNHPRLGLTADTNNFRTDLDMPYEPEPDSIPRYVDRYRGLEILMPLANWVSAKFYRFDNAGHEISMDYPRILKIILDSGYRGHLSVEYEGEGDTLAGVRKSVEMLRTLRRHFRQQGIYG